MTKPHFRRYNPPRGAPRRLRSLVHGGETWRYRVGQTAVRFVAPDGRSFAEAIDVVADRHPDLIERGRWKRSSDAWVTPGDVARYLARTQPAPGGAVFVDHIDVRFDITTTTADDGSVTLACGQFKIVGYPDANGMGAAYNARRAFTAYVKALVTDGVARASETNRRLAEATR